MKRTIYKVITIFLTAGLLSAVPVSAAQLQEAPTQVSQEQPIIDVDAVSEKQEVPETKTIGENTEGAVQFEFVNGTGKDINYLDIRVGNGADQKTEEIKKMQSALIEQGYLDDIADGLVGPKTNAAITEFREKNGLSAEAIMDDEMLTLLFGTDGNLLAENEVIKPDENVIVFYQEEEKTSETDVRNAGSEFLMNAEYYVVFRLTEEEKDTEYILHTIPVNETRITILLEDGVAYVEYKETGSDKVNSTLEAEKAILQQDSVSQTTSSYSAQEYSYYDNSDYDDYYYDDYIYDDYTYDDYTYNDYEDYAQADDFGDAAVDDTQTADGCLADDALLYD